MWKFVCLKWTPNNGFSQTALFKNQGQTVGVWLKRDPKWIGCPEKWERLKPAVWWFSFDSYPKWACPERFWKDYHLQHPRQWQPMFACFLTSGLPWTYFASGNFFHFEPLGAGRMGSRSQRGWTQRPERTPLGWAACPSQPQADLPWVSLCFVRVPCFFGWRRNKKKGNLKGPIFLGSSYVEGSLQFLEHHRKRRLT